MSAERLVVAYNFPPFADGSSTTVAKRIVEAGRAVDVISADLSRVRSRDASLSDLVAPFVRRHTMLSVPTGFSDSRSATAFVEAGLLATQSDSFSEYEDLFSRSMFPHSHLLAAHLRSRRPDLRWSAEFSDPLLWNVDGTERLSGRFTAGALTPGLLSGIDVRGQHLLTERESVLEWAQFLPFLLADELVFTNEQQRTVMIADAPPWLQEGALERSVISPHPSLPRVSQAPRRADPGPRFRIGYFGTFYPNRGGGDLLTAISLLPRAVRRRLSVEVFADATGALLDAAEALGVRDVILPRTPLPWREAIEAMADCDALLANDIATTPFGLPSPFLPSKLSDYVASGTPVMAICLPGSPLEGSATVRWRAEVGDADGIRDMLVEAIAPEAESIIAP